MRLSTLGAQRETFEITLLSTSKTSDSSRTNTHRPQSSPTARHCTPLYQSRSLSSASFQVSTPQKLMQTPPYTSTSVQEHDHEPRINSPFQSFTSLQNAVTHRTLSSEDEDRFYPEDDGARTDAEGGGGYDGRIGSTLHVVVSTTTSDWPTPHTHCNVLSTITGCPMVSDGKVDQNESSTAAAAERPDLTSGIAFPRFLYTLLAPTSAAVRLNEETLTYLNQGQAYEIVCKRVQSPGYNDVPPTSSLRGHQLNTKTIARISFHAQRERYKEREMWVEWRHRQENPDPKLIELCANLSTGISNTRQEMKFMEWSWSGECRVFFKVHCLSTEFTEKKHGGEKGVPFRLQLDTFTQDSEGGEIGQMHSAYCQIKVFRIKGADRKNKTDRMKAEKAVDRDRYQPGYEYTMFTETFPHDRSTAQPYSPSPSRAAGTAAASDYAASATSGNDQKRERETVAGSSSHSSSGSAACLGTSTVGPEVQNLTGNSNVEDVVRWLRRNRFHQFAGQFSSYSDYNAVYLKSYSVQELVKRIEPLLHLPPNNAIAGICVSSSPSNVPVLLTDEVLATLPDESCYILEAVPNDAVRHGAGLSAAGGSATTTNHIHSSIADRRQGHHVDTGVSSPNTTVLHQAVALMNVLNSAAHQQAAGFLPHHPHGLQNPPTGGRTLSTFEEAAAAVTAAAAAAATRGQPLPLIPAAAAQHLQAHGLHPQHQNDNGRISGSLALTWQIMMVRQG